MSRRPFSKGTIDLLDRDEEEKGSSKFWGVLRGNVRTEARRAMADRVLANPDDLQNLAELANMLYLEAKSSGGKTLSELLKVSSLLFEVVYKLQDEVGGSFLLKYSRSHLEYFKSCGIQGWPNSPPSYSLISWFGGCLGDFYNIEAAMEGFEKALKHFENAADSKVGEEIDLPIKHHEDKYLL